MAEEKITANEFIDPSVLKELQAINKEMKDMIKTISQFMAVSKANNEELKKTSTTQEEVGKRVKTTQENSQKLSDVEKEIQKIEQQHYNVLTKMVAERSEENKKLQEAIEQRKKENIERKASINSIEGLRAKNQLLRQERDKLIISDKNYAANLKKINDQINKNDKAITDASSTLEKQRFNIGNYKSAWAGVVSVFGKVLGVLGAVGISASTFHKIIASSETLTDKYEAAMKGIATATSAFFVSIRDGDWSNLLDNMKNAYERGKKYQETMDSLSKTERANLLILKEKREEFLTLREQAMDQNLTAQQNYDAAKKALDLLRSNYKIQEEVVQKQINNQAYLLNLKTGENLSDQQKIENTKVIMRAYIDRDKIDKDVRDRAEEINSKLKYQQELLKLNSLIPFRTKSVDDEAKAYQKEIDSLTSLTDDYRIYAAVLRMVEDKKSPDSIKNYIALMDKQAEATSAFNDENKRMIQTLSKNEAAIKKEKTESVKVQIEDQNKLSKQTIDNWSKEWSQQEQFKEQWEKDKDAQAKVQEQMNADIDKNNKEREQGEIDADKRTIERERSKAEEIKNIQSQLNDYKLQIANQSFELVGELYNRQVSDLERQKEYELSLVGDNAKAKEGIETKYASKIAAIKRKQAIAEKAQSLFNIGINTAQAIIKFLADPGGYPGLALSIAAGILGAAQAATVAAQPIPKFAKGVTDFEGGRAIVGEEGREAIRLSSGKVFLSPDTATQMMLPSGTDVYTHAETEAMLRGGMQADRFDKLISEQRATRKALVSKPVKEIKITDSGWKETTRLSNAVITHTDKYFRK